MIRTVVALTVATALAVPAFAVGKPASVSWGKPNVSYASYNADAQQCANMAFGVDAPMQPATVEALGAQQAMALYAFFSFWSARDHGGDMAAAYAVRPDKAPLRSTTYTSLFEHAAYVDVVEQLQAVVDRCLTERGYQKFRLTNAQRDQLRQLKMGTAEREHFLHRLGADPEVLAAQRV